MITMTRQDDTRQTPQEMKQTVLKRTGKAVGTLAFCTALTGCTAAAPQVRPPPEPAECPAGSTKAMADKFDVRIGDEVSAYFQTTESAHDVAVREGPTSVELGPLSPSRPGGYIFLSGTLTVSEKRIYGRFTEARIRDEPPFPVCFEVRDGLKGGRGAIRRRLDGPDSAYLYSTVDVRAVHTFE
jgi:serine/threonine-protein kinase